MTTPNAKRRLSAILMADVVGYSRLLHPDNQQRAIAALSGMGMN